mgnify:CR=1 FL=1
MQLLEKRYNLIPKFHADVIAPNWEIVTRDWVDACKKRGQEMYVWTVNDPDVASRLANWGVDTLISDNPELIGKTLRHG